MIRDDKKCVEVERWWVHYKVDYHCFTQDKTQMKEKKGRQIVTTIQECESESERITRSEDAGKKDE